VLVHCGRALGSNAALGSFPKPSTTIAMGCDEMDIGENQLLDKSPRAVRGRLPNRRCAISTSFERDGASFEMTAGYYPDGRVGEVFVNADRANSLLDFLMSDAAILASLALQYGAPLDEIRHALKRDGRGQAASPIGAALDRIT
jgi:hypothetical protein